MTTPIQYISVKTDEEQKQQQQSELEVEASIRELYTRKESRKCPEGQFLWPTPC